MTGLSVQELRKSYGGEEVLKAVSFDAPPGSFVVIVGPSGCGKTTLLRCLAGLEAVESGRLSVGATDITEMSPSARNVAMVFQNYALYPTKTVYQNIAFGLRQRRLPRDEIERRVKHAAGQLQIGHLMGRRPAQLSGGQRQRVAIGRAMVRDPALFLFDEAGRPADRHARRPDRANGSASGSLCPAAQPLRRRLHRQPGDELPALRGA